MSDQPITQKGRRTRQAIVDAATVVFARKGLFDTRITDIAEEAGVSPAAFYRYFDAKHDILGEAVDGARDQVLAALRTRAEDDGGTTPFVRFGLANSRYLRAYRANVAVVRMLDQRLAIDDEFRVARRDWHPAFVGRLEAGLRRLADRGLIRASVDPAFCAPALSAMVENIASVNFVLRGSDRVPASTFDAIHMVWGNVLGLAWTMDELDELREADRTSGDPIVAGAGAGEEAGSAAPIDDARPLPTSRKGAATRAQLLEAARIVFERRGFLDTRVADVVAEASVAHGTFYNYFDSRDDVFRALGTQLRTALVDALDARAGELRASGAPAHDRIATEIAVTHDFYRRNRRLFAVLEQYASIDVHGAAFRLEMRRIIVDRVRHSVEVLARRACVDPRLEPDGVAEVLVSMVDRSLFEWHVLGIEADAEAGGRHLPVVWTSALGLADAGSDAA